MKLRQTSIILAVAIGLWLGGCSEKNPESPPSVGEPPSIFITAPASALMNEAVLVTIGLFAGDYPIEGASVDFESDGEADTTLENPAPGTIQLQHSFGDSGLFVITGIVWDDHEQLDTSRRNITIGSYVFELSVEPDSGIAPLASTLHLTHRAPATFQRIRVDWTGDGLFDTSFTPTTSETAIPVTYGVGHFEIRAEAQLSDTILVRTDSVQSLNTPPYGEIPFAYCVEDSMHQLPTYDLSELFTDDQTPDDLTFNILDQTGPVTHMLDGTYLTPFYSPPDANGAGTVTIKVSDQNEGSTNYVYQYNVEPMTDHYYSLGDLETLEPISEGTITFNGQEYFITPENPVVHFQTYFAPSVEVQAKETCNGENNSYVSTHNIPASYDMSSDTMLLVSSWSGLPEDMPPTQYYNFIVEARAKSIPDGQGGYKTALQSEDFETLANDSLWIAYRHPITGAVFYQADRDSIEQRAINYIWPLLETSMIPHIYQATPTDSTPYILPLQPSREMCLTLPAGQGNDIITLYDDGLDCITNRALIELRNNPSPKATIQEILTWLICSRASVTQSVEHYQSILHDNSSLNSPSRADEKLAREATHMRPGDYLLKWYLIPE